MQQVPLNQRYSTDAILPVYEDCVHENNLALIGENSSGNITHLLTIAIPGLFDRFYIRVLHY